ncbi:MAG: hypothetical protein ACI4WW_02550 [Candidatus Coprovivens sp.]
MQEVKEKKNWFKIFKSRIYILSIVIVSIGYVFYGLFNVETTGKTIVEIIGSCIISLLIGLSITTFLRKEGFRSGRLSDIFQSSLLDYAESKEKAQNNFDKLNQFCAYKTEQEIIAIKREIIINANLKYDTFVKGGYNNKILYEKLEDYQKKALKHAQNVRVKPYQTKDLLSDLPNETKFNHKRFGYDENDYIRAKGISSFITKILLSIIGGYFTLAPLNTGNISQCVWNAIQICIWLLFGTIDFMNAKEFILNDYRQTHIVQKSSLLKEFNTLMINNPHKLDNYDYELMYQNAIEEEKKKLEVNEDGIKQFEEN